MLKNIEEKLKILERGNGNINTGNKKTYGNTKEILIENIKVSSTSGCKIESESVAITKKKTFTTKKETPKLIENDLTYKDYYIYLIDTKTETFKEITMEYIKLQSDEERHSLLIRHKLLEEYNRSIDRYINNKIKNELTNKLYNFQNECIQLFESRLTDIDTFKETINTINRFKESTKRSPKLKKEYIIAIKTLETLQKRTQIKVLDLFEINTPIEDIHSSDLFIVSINKQITEINELRESINEETRKINEIITLSKHLASNMRDKIINELLHQPQQSRYKGFNWSQLTDEQKTDRINSYIRSDIYSMIWNKIHETNVITIYKLPENIIEKAEEEIIEITKELTEKIIKKEIKYTKIKWRKDEGILYKISLDPSLQLSDRIIELIGLI